ncbi:hypothetical protein SCARR_03672 [Pontiella sulfatireligans]|uniref:Uncharacterized protein n=1 Tax=Pontiella sulfatireligans TaxID=2750658 RepID=A0A6C2UN43_9BACT|nr:hypothetical protein SCARR_03672 [Pontiella sulfatireligans]
MKLKRTSLKKSRRNSKAALSIKRLGRAKKTAHLLGGFFYACIKTFSPCEKRQTIRGNRSKRMCFYKANGLHKNRYLIINVSQKVDH